MEAEDGERSWVNIEENRRARDPFDVITGTGRQENLQRLCVRRMLIQRQNREDIIVSWISLNVIIL
jgi:hypothetical protein